MPLSAGSRLGPYEIVAPLGAGGMGEVYRARDPRMGREVAIKFSAERFSHRFEREVHAVAALNHPNICQVYDVGPNYLVMELIEGPTLSDRIKAGAIPFDEALAIARQIGEALEAAHEKGVVHRDLKPANIKIKPDGTVKVLDFGLAKIVAEAMAAGSPDESPTIPMGATIVGQIMGTAAYMAPEQARGNQVDKRADIWAFGVVVYEMLTGRRLFEGTTVTDTLAQVLTKDPDLNTLQPGIRPLLRRCLARDPRKRLRDIGDACLELEGPVAQFAPASVTQPRRSEFFAWILAITMTIAAAVITVVHLRQSPPAAPLVRFSVPPPERGGYGSWLSLSPDGRYLGFTATGADGIARVWLRSLDSLQLRPMTGTEGSVTLFWSPDSRYVVFQSLGKLKKADVSGGLPQTLCDGVGVLLGGSWNQNGVILFGSNSGPIMRLPSSGGTPTPVTKVDQTRDETNHTDPIFLPDGLHFLYVRRSSHAENRGVYIGSLNADPAGQSLKRLQATDFSYAYAPPRAGVAFPRMGYLLFLGEENLMAQRFDHNRLELMGEPFPIAEQVGTTITRAYLSVSATGVLAYRGADTGNSELDWYDRQGHPLGRAGEPGQYYNDVALLDDGSKIAYSRPSLGGNRQVWVLQPGRGLNAPLTFVPDGARLPIWSRDGAHLAFGSIRRSTLYVKDAANNGADLPIVQSGGLKFPNDWSRDGKFILYTETATSLDLMAISNPLGPGDRKMVPVANSGFNEAQGRFSPDSRWVAYASDVSGRYEIYVLPFPPGGHAGKLVSSSGGSQPRWRADGKELYYLQPDQKLMAVDISTEPSFQSLAPHPLFQISAITMSSNTPSRYDVTQDGRRFLVVKVAAAPGTSSSAVVMLNWDTSVKN